MSAKTPGPGAGIVIPVDGPAGSGKSTMAKALADHLGWDYLETGALYRAIGLKVIDLKGDLDDPAFAAKCAESLAFGCKKTASGWRNFLEGVDVTEELRDERMSDAASRVSSHPGVREALLEFQRSFGKERGAILDGRDIGTVVFPSAPLKFFLEASREVRIQRRLSELREKGVSFDEERLGEDLRLRDERDSTRQAAPLRPAADAFIIDTSDKPIDRVFEIMLERICAVYSEVIEVR